MKYIYVYTSVAHVESRLPQVGSRVITPSIGVITPLKNVKAIYRAYFTPFVTIVGSDLVKINSCLLSVFLSQTISTCNRKIVSNRDICFQPPKTPKGTSRNPWKCNATLDALGWSPGLFELDMFGGWNSSYPNVIWGLSSWRPKEKPPNATTPKREGPNSRPC